MANEEKFLADAYELALKKSTVSIPSELQGYLDVILKHSETRKGVLAVTITSILKKCISPEQDIRKHQSKMAGGYSARTLDTSFVTPFLSKFSFPYMASGAGALTRSLEQSVPYGQGYTGAIKPSELKPAFDGCIEYIQTRPCQPKDLLVYIFNELIAQRDRTQNIKLIRPQNLSIKDIICVLNSHFELSKKASNLPVLAIYAVYELLILEVKRYKGCTLRSLQHHNTADDKSGLLGDVQVDTPDGYPLEVVEIKHGIKLTTELVDECYAKFSTSAVKTYYLLSTNEKIPEISKISERVIEIYRTQGCQMIVNGIQSTLKYYLRLLSDPLKFVDKYLLLVEERCDYETKVKWNDIITKFSG